MKTTKIILLLLILIGFNWTLNSQTDYLNQWPQFRGPFASGIVESTSLPDFWDVETGENIKWRIRIPGLSHSCPVIWEDKIFITTAISESESDSLKLGLYGDIESYDDESIHEFRVMCINKYSGEILWDKLAHKDVPRTKRHTKATHANPSAATNGEYVIFSFGSEGMYCFDFDGNQIWKKDFGTMNSGYYRAPKVEWGFASSPILHENTVVVQCDFLGDSFLAAFDVKNGKEKWKTKRKDVPTWSTPNYYNKDGINQIIVNGYKHAGGYDFKTGKELWKLSDGGDIPVPTPFFAHDLIYIHSAHGKSSPIFAISPNSKGNISLKKKETENKFIKWSIKRGAAYNPTNIVYGDYLYNMSMWGSLTCYDAKNGEVIYNQKVIMDNGITASAIASNGKLYYATEAGNVFIIKAGKEYQEISKISLHDNNMTTPAISENMIFFRTQNYLMAVGK